MKKDASKPKFEVKTLRAMISIYCDRSHNGGSQLCPDCSALENYALTRIERCAFGPNKPNCADCPIHCYEAAMRERILRVMRFSGPLMLRRHPLLTLRHLMRGARRKPVARPRAGK